MFELICVNLVTGTKKVVEAFDSLSSALAAERELQALADKFEKEVTYEVEKVTV